MLGPNGAGKSTTFSMLSMRIKRSEGNIRLIHKEIDSIHISKDKIKIGMVA